jgi:hypothetical protein
LPSAAKKSGAFDDAPADLACAGVDDGAEDNGVGAGSLMPAIKAHSTDPNKLNIDAIWRIIDPREVDVDQIWRKFDRFGMNHDPKSVEIDR